MVGQDPGPSAGMNKSEFSSTGCFDHSGVDESLAVHAGVLVFFAQSLTDVGELGWVLVLGHGY